MDNGAAAAPKLNDFIEKLSTYFSDFPISKISFNLSDFSVERQTRIGYLFLTAIAGWYGHCHNATMNTVGNMSSFLISTSSIRNVPKEKKIAE